VQTPVQDPERPPEPPAATPPPVVPAPVTQTPEEAAAEAEQRKAAAAAAAAALVEDSNRRRERAQAERKAREAAEVARRSALDESLAQRAAELKEESMRRRRDEAPAAAAADAGRVSARVAAAAKIDVPPEIDGEGGVQTKAQADGAQARARVGAWRVKAMPTRAPVEAPRVPSDFTKQYALIRKDAAALYEYCALIPPEQCPAIFSPEIPSDVLVAVAKAISECVTSEAAKRWCEWLGMLTKAGRFEMTVLMLDRPARVALSGMFDALVERLAEGESIEPAAASERLRKLRASYLGKE
jgi:hypothetical protein